MRKTNFIFMSNTSVINSYTVYGIFVQLLDLETKSRMEKGVQGITSLDTYFAKMREIVTEKKTSSRVRFLMQDVIGKWQLELAKQFCESLHKIFWKTFLQKVLVVG